MLAELANKLAQSPLTTVDDIFSHFSIPEIQQLRKEYGDIIASLKSELFSLVGNKYRDLIKIAEDIEELYGITEDVDSKLADLSYKPVKFTSFTMDSSEMKLNSSLRRIKAEEAKTRSQPTLLRDLINNKLIKLDLKIEKCKKDKKLPLNHTSNFIFYAKLYYSMEIVFKHNIENDEALKQKFASLKRNFLEFIERELMSFNLYDNAYRIADKFKPTQRYTPLAGYSEGEGDDFYLGDNEVDSSEYYESEDLSVRQVYTHNSLPMSNYLLTYVILNASINNLSEVASKFIELRFNYLKNFILVDNPPLYGVFKYIETTAQYLELYFQKLGNELFRNCRSYLKPWKASSVLGFTNWFSQTISFLINIDTYTGDGVLKKFVGEVFNYVTDSIQTTTGLSSKLGKYCDVITALKNLESAIDNGHVIQYVQKDEACLLLLSELLKQAAIVYQEHLAQLKDILETADKFDSQSRTDQSLHAICDLMDDNVDNYITQLSSSASKDQFVSELTRWFDILDGYDKMIQMQEETPIASIVNLRVNWLPEGKITETFTKLREELASSLENERDVLISKLNEKITACDSLLANYHYLEVLLFLGKKFDSDKISQMKSQVYLFVIEDIGSKYADQIKSHTKVSEDDNEDSVTRPTLMLCSVMYNFARDLCGASYSSYFFDDSFKTVKNEWVKRHISAKEDTDNDQTTANKIFLSEFVGDASETDSGILKNVRLFYNSNCKLYAPLSV